MCFVSGSARVGGAPSVWSVILKVLPGTPASPTKWNHPACEALAYERGLLEDLPPAAAVLLVTPSTAASMTCGLRTSARMRCAGSSTSTGRHSLHLNKGVWPSGSRPLGRCQLRLALNAVPPRT